MLPARKSHIGEVIRFRERHHRMARNVRGVENREGISELPLDGDIGRRYSIAFSDRQRLTLYYWHDSGHAPKIYKERMWNCGHTEQLLLENNKRLDRILDLHDVNDQGMDHQPIGKRARSISTDDGGTSSSPRTDQS